MVSASELERLSETDSQGQKSSTPTTPRSTTLAARIPTELHLRGTTVAEALPLVEKYLDQAFTNGLARVRLIHGIGRGRLREHITALLGQHPLVRRFQAGDAGGGTTIVELEG
jgi:DNA mismatch repair protein MutS2